MKLLYLDSSIQRSESASRLISAEIVTRLTAVDPTLKVIYHDLANDPLPHLTLDSLSGEEAEALVGEFMAADIVVIGTGMYNFTIPTQLKAWIDRILVAGKTFRYSENGPEGLATGKRIIVALTRGDAYGPGTPIVAFEHAETYLRTVFEFIGITSPEFIIAEGLAFGDEARSTSMSEALERARALTYALDPISAE